MIFLYTIKVINPAVKVFIIKMIYQLQMTVYRYPSKYINVNYLWMTVNKLKVLILQELLFLFFPQINSPSSNR